MHIISRDGKYILFDNSSMKIYKLDKSVGENLYKLGDKALNQDIPEIKENTKEYKENICRGSRLVLVISQMCNMACRYCYAQAGTYGNKENSKMELETLKNAIEFSFNKFPDGVDKIQFFGGEPLTNFELMKESIDWIIGEYKSRNLEIPLFTIVTNGTLINSEIHDFFNKYGFVVTISLDGGKNINDVNRVFKGSNKGTFDTIKNNINMMNRDREYDLMIEMTLDDANIEQFIETGELKDINELRELKPDMFHIVPAIWDENVKKRDNEEKYIEYLKKYFETLIKESKKTLFSSNPIRVMKALDMTRNIIKQNKKEYLCSAGIYEYSIAANGDIYPCFGFIGKDDFLMGNVNTCFEKDIFNGVVEICRCNKYENIDECKECWANGICSSCIANSFLVKGRIDKPIKSLCEVQKTMIEEIIIQCSDMI